MVEATTIALIGGLLAIGGFLANNEEKERTKRADIRRKEREAWIKKCQHNKKTSNSFRKSQFHDNKSNYTVRPKKKNKHQPNFDSKHNSVTKKYRVKQKTRTDFCFRCNGKGTHYHTLQKCSRCMNGKTATGHYCNHCQGTGIYQPARTVVCNRCHGSGM